MEVIDLDVFEEKYYRQSNPTQPINSLHRLRYTTDIFSGPRRARRL